MNNRRVFTLEPLLQWIMMTTKCDLYRTYMCFVHDICSFYLCENIFRNFSAPSLSFIPLSHPTTRHYRASAHTVVNIVSTNQNLSPRMWFTVTAFHKNFFSIKLYFMNVVKLLLELECIG